VLLLLPAVVSVSPSPHRSRTEPAGSAFVLFAMPLRVLRRQPVCLLGRSACPRMRVRERVWSESASFDFEISAAHESDPANST
jgi:hypothetical protein